MAKKSGGPQDAKYITEGPLPVDMAGTTPFTGTGFPVGEYEFELTGFAGATSDKGGESVIGRFKCIAGPNETQDMAGQTFYEYFTTKAQDGSTKPKGFLLGFIAQLCPPAADSENMFTDKKGRKLPYTQYVIGAKFRAALREESYKNEQDKEVKRVKLNRGTVKLLTPTQAAVQKFGAAAVGGSVEKGGNGVAAGQPEAPDPAEQAGWGLAE